MILFRFLTFHHLNILNLKHHKYTSTFDFQIAISLFQKFNMHRKTHYKVVKIKFFFFV